MSRQKIVDYYKKNWPYFIKLWQVDKTHCIHYGYYEKGIRTHVEAVLNMNDYIEQLLELDLKSKETKYILDAGCGIGGTVVHLAKKYLNIKFIGITIVPEHIQMAKEFAKENHTNSNTDFLLIDYLSTRFNSAYFDAIFSIESINYTSQTRGFINEMNRILKTNGKLVIIDAFRTNVPLNPFLNTIYRWYCKGREFPSIVKLNEFKSFLKDEEFGNIVDINLKRNVLPSVIRGNMVSIPYLFLTTMKKFIQGKKYHSSKDSCFPTAVSIFSTMIGMKKGVTYNAVKAIKK